MLFLVLLSLASTAFASPSRVGVITKVHVTTLNFVSASPPTDEKLCEVKCDIAYKYFTGQMGEVVGFCKNTPDGAMLDSLCKKDSCAGCGFCNEERGD